MKRDIPKHLAVALIATLVLPAANCKKKPIDQVATKPDAKPKVEIRVDKRYDDKGNIIEFDSLYASYYSHLPKNKYMMDTLFNSFHRSFLDKRPGLFDERFNRMFLHDSLYSDFFHKDFFTRRYEMNDPYLRHMMHELDSIKNKHFRELSEKHPVIRPK